MKLLKCIFALAMFVLTDVTAGAQYFTATVSPDSMALVTIACAGVRTAPGHSNELASQAVMGTPVRLLDKDGSWWHVETPEGYTGYIIASSLHCLDSVSYNHWKGSKRVVVQGSETQRIVNADGPVSDVHPESILEVVDDSNECYVVKIPDGRLGQLKKSVVVDMSYFFSHKLNVDSLIARGRKFMGESYLWGGTTAAAMDCSGLAKVLYQGEGIILRRDASQQFISGLRLGTDYRDYEKGDLVFFMSASTGNIVHVGIYIGGGLYLHSYGRVKINSLNPQSPSFIPSNILAGACRIKGHEDTPGITRISSHPWYN